jgi:hypothetical protein
MFRVSLRPSSGATTAVGDSGLLLEHDGSGAVGSSGKLEAATAVVKLLMMGIRMPKTC